ncbi:MAG: hypothetical protein ACTSWP_01560 [Candidatus Freyarchaeota archaeon]|nr:hypothetical protein [Candidatus Freyrarchaeum guaymaensis]
MLRGHAEGSKILRVGILPSEQAKAAIKYGCASCGSCVARLVENVGLKAQQTSCIADEPRMQLVHRLTPSLTKGTVSGS